MKDLVPPHVERMIPYRPGKPVEELERELGIKNAVKLASNENPLGPSPKVVEVLRSLASHTSRYPDGAAYELRRAVADHHAVGMDEVCLGNGSNELIDLLPRTFVGAGEHVVFGKPSFVCYWLAATASGAEFTEVPLRDHLHWDVDALLAAVRPETKLLFLANPNNPTGAYLGREDLSRLLTELPPQVVAVVDEAYVDFPDAEDYVSALELRQLRERLIVLRTFSKAHGLAALRVGYAIGDAALVGYLRRMRAPFNVNSFGQVAARIALEDPEHVAQYVAMNRSERRRVTSALSELGLTVAPSQANFVLVDFARPGAEVYDALLHQGVIVRPMAPPIDTWQRITLGTPQENDRLLAAIAATTAT